MAWRTFIESNVSICSTCDSQATCVAVTPCHCGATVSMYMYFISFARGLESKQLEHRYHSVVPLILLAS